MKTQRITQLLVTVVTALVFLIMLAVKYSENKQELIATLLD